MTRDPTSVRKAIEAALAQARPFALSLSLFALPLLSAPAKAQEAPKPRLTKPKASKPKASKPKPTDSQPGPGKLELRKSTIREDGGQRIELPDGTVIIRPKAASPGRTVITIEGGRVTVTRERRLDRESADRNSADRNSADRDSVDRDSGESESRESRRAEPPGFGPNPREVPPALRRWIEERSRSRTEGPATPRWAPRPPRDLEELEELDELDELEELDELDELDELEELDELDELDEIRPRFAPGREPEFGERFGEGFRVIPPELRRRVELELRRRVPGFRPEVERDEDVPSCPRCKPEDGGSGLPRARRALPFPGGEGRDAEGGPKRLTEFQWERARPATPQGHTPRRVEVLIVPGLDGRPQARVLEKSELESFEWHEAPPAPARPGVRSRTEFRVVPGRQFEGALEGERRPVIELRELRRGGPEADRRERPRVIFRSTPAIDPRRAPRLY